MGRGVIHDRVILDRVEWTLQDLGFETHREFRVNAGPVLGFIDLMAWRGATRISVEAECSTERVLKDIAKAQAAGANWLYVITPNRRVADAARTKLRSKPPRARTETPRVLCMPLGSALTALRRFQTL